MRLIKHLQDVNSHCQTVHGIGHFSAGNFWSVWKATCRGFLVLFGNGRVRWFQIIEQSLHSRTSTHIHIAPSLFECFPLKLRQHKSLTVRAQWSSTIVLVDTIYIYCMTDLSIFYLTGSACIKEIYSIQFRETSYKETICHIQKNI